VKCFFYSSTLLRCVNAIRIALALKVETPTTMNDFRTISCCNVMYKYISKVIMNRLNEIFLKIIGPTQNAFVLRRQIFDAILLTQKLMLDYHLASYMSRCALEIDIKKAFDIVSCDFILTGLRAIGAPGVMVRWIEVCMSTTYFSMAMNGENHGLFPSFKGLQQDDSLSSYFFCFGYKRFRRHS